MGNCNFKTENHEDNSSKSSIYISPFFLNPFFSLFSALSKNNFQFHFVVGRGGFGKVT